VKQQLKLYSLFILIATGLLAYSCQPDYDTASDPMNITFSQDTIYLDTVFSTVGSSTRSFTIRNTSNENILIDKIVLGKGRESPFRINVNGLTGQDINNIILPAFDSLWVFVELTAPASGTEMIWTDSIVVSNKGYVNDVKLISLALDAHFYFPNKAITIKQSPPYSDIIIPYSILPKNAIWSNDKPHVVYGYAIIDSGGTLDILSETKVHFHSGSGLWISSGGELKIDEENTGSYSNPVILEGDRLEPFYNNIAGQWGGLFGGLFIQRGGNASINNAWIKNGTIGIRCDSVSELGKRNLIIKNSRITDFSRVSIYSGFGNIEMENVVVANAGLYGLYCLGGRVFIDHCTFINEFPASRSTPMVGLFNRYDDGSGQYRYRDLREAYFGNCIISGSRESELGFDFDLDADFNYQIQGCLIKIKPNHSAANYDLTNASYFYQCVFNEDPSFILQTSYNYELDSSSKAIDIGLSAPAIRVPYDAQKKYRIIDPDAGALEKN
jgi:hypothetical protein